MLGASGATAFQLIALPCCSELSFPHCNCGSSVPLLENTVARGITTVVLPCRSYKGQAIYCVSCMDQVQYAADYDSGIMRTIKVCINGGKETA